MPLLNPYKFFFSFFFSFFLFANIVFFPPLGPNYLPAYAEGVRAGEWHLLCTLFNRLLDWPQVSMFWCISPSFFSIVIFIYYYFSGLQVVGQHVIGLNPLHLNNLNTVMDRALRGHPYVKAAIGKRTYTKLLTWFSFHENVFSPNYYFFLFCYINWFPT